MIIQFAHDGVAMEEVAGYREGERIINIRGQLVSASYYPSVVSRETAAGKLLEWMRDRQAPDA